MTEITTWRDRMPRGVLDPLCARGEPVNTPTDRRMLWHVEGMLSVAATNETLHQLATDVYRYLCETCEHHWHSYEGDEDIPAHRQCLWCNDVEWRENGSEGIHLRSVWRHVRNQLRRGRHYLRLLRCQAVPALRRMVRW